MARDITEFDELEMMRIRKKIGMVFQEGALFDSLSVYDNVAYRLHEESVDEDEVEHEVTRMLRFVGSRGRDRQNADRAFRRHAPPRRHRPGAGRNPSIVLFDEPTAGLDPPTARTICELAIKLRDIEDVSSIFVTHEMNNLDYLSSEYAIVEEDGTVNFEVEGEQPVPHQHRGIMLAEAR